MAHYVAFTGKQEDLADLKAFFEKIRNVNKRFYFWQYNTGKLKFEYEITLPYRKPEHVQFHFYVSDLVGFEESDKRKNIFHLYFRNDFTVTIDAESLIPLAVTTWKEEADGARRPDRAKELEKENGALKEEIKHREKLIEEHEKFRNTVEQSAASLKDALARARAVKRPREKGATSHP
jgi:hypothetical protein